MNRDPEEKTERYGIYIAQLYDDHTVGPLQVVAGVTCARNGAVRNVDFDTSTNLENPPIIARLHKKLAKMKEQGKPEARAERIQRRLDILVESPHE